MTISIYSTLVFIHVLSAVISIGPLFVVIPIIARLRYAEVENESAYLALIQVIIRMVMHAGHVLVVTGVLLLILGPWAWNASWVLATWAVMLLSAVFLARGFTRVLKNFHVPGMEKEQITKRLLKTTWTYIGLLLIMLWLMVQKPSLW